MSFGFPTKVVTEGGTRVVVPKHEAYIMEAWEYAPSKAPVFYNPAMELNRDISILALQSYQRMVGREISVCEPFTGCGVRGVRFATEVEGVRNVIVNDINPEAASLAKFNAKLNKLSNRVIVTNEDANLLLSRYAAPRKRFNFIDIDPFGSPVPYLDASLRALRSGGLLALTATDMAPLCGVHPKACVRKYGGMPLRTEYCHELAVRLLIGCLTMTAAKHDIGIKVLFSHSTDHSIRIYAVIRYGAKCGDDSVRMMGYLLHCFSCFYRKTSMGLVTFLDRKCPECGSLFSVSGPLWLGKISDENFCVLMEKEVDGRGLHEEKKILKLLSIARNEAEAPLSYYVIDKICDKMNLHIPPLGELIEELKRAGFQAKPTHFNNTGIRTNAPISLLNTCIRRLTRR